MSIISKLASSQKIRSEEPNKELAATIVKSKSKKDIQELVDNLANKDKGIQSDCIKTLDEIAQASPTLVADHAPALVKMLDSKNNRLQWGAMTALDAITLECPQLIYKALPKIIAVADKGSVITTDHCVGILTKLCTIDRYKKDAFPLYMEQLWKAPVNQLPMYAEKALPVIDKSNAVVFLDALAQRLEEVEQEPKRKRIQKVIKKIKG